MMPLGRPKRMWYMLPAPHTPLDPAATPVPPPLPMDALDPSLRPSNPLTGKGVLRLHLDDVTGLPAPPDGEPERQIAVRFSIILSSMDNHI